MIERIKINAAILYKDKKGCEKKDKFSLEEKTRLATINITAKITLERIIPLIRRKKSDFSLRRLVFICL